MSQFLALMFVIEKARFAQPTAFATLPPFTGPNRLTQDTSPDSFTFWRLNIKKTLQKKQFFSIKKSTFSVLLTITPVIILLLLIPNVARNCC